MAWTHYRLRFRLLAPLHVGWRKTGNLMQTRPYVPGRLLWAALTARLTRNAGQGHDAQAYQDVGKRVQEYFRFGYLWPSLDGKHPYFPWEHPADFEYLLLGSYMSTSLHPQSTTAEEGSLHEVEFLAPTARDGRPVFLLGDLWVSEDDLPNDPANLGDWKAALSYLQLGGERGYGWGRVRLVECQEDGLSWEEGWDWQEAGEEVEVSYKGGNSTRLPVHALAVPYEEEKPVESTVVGPVEPWLGWERGTSGFRISQARILYQPSAEVPSGFRGILHPWGYLIGGLEEGSGATS